MYDLKTNEHGMVKVTKKAGSAYVVTHLPEGMCRGLIANAETVKSSNRWEGMGIVINGDEIYFEGTCEEDAPEVKSEPKTEAKNNGWKKHDRR